MCLPLESVAARRTIIMISGWIQAAFRAGWRASRPFGVLAAAALVGLALAIILWNTLVPLLQALIHALAWIVNKLRPLFTNISPPDVKSTRNIGIGVGTFGAVVVLSTLKDTHQSITALIQKWTVADRTVLLPAFSSVLVAFTALGLSVYGIAELQPKPLPATIAFDSAAIPPAVVNSETGAITFYVSFLEEGGRQSLTKPDHESVTLRSPDEAFLKRLSEGLQRCHVSTRFPKLSVRGFASGSFWGGAARELAELSRQKPTDPEIQKALAETNGYAAKDDIYAQDPALAVARAFNVYLANRRRAAVLSALAAKSHDIAVEDSGLWSSYAQMDNALAIEDRGATGQAAAAGILTRSVAVTITDAAACSRAPQFARVELALPSG